MAAPTFKGDWEIQSLFPVAVCSAARFASSVTKRERAVVAGGEPAGCLGKSSDAVENIAARIRGPTFAFQSALSLPWVSVSSPVKGG